MNKDTGYTLRFVLHMREVIYGSVDRPGFLARIFSGIFGRDRNIFDRGEVDTQLVNNVEVTNRIMQSGQFRVTPSGTVVPSIMLEIPLLDVQEQNLNIIVDNQRLSLNVQYSAVLKTWSVSVYHSDDARTPILKGRALVPDSFILSDIAVINEVMGDFYVDSLISIGEFDDQSMGRK